MCTIAAATSFPDPFNMQGFQRRLSYAQKAFAGCRHSDHVALLCAFQEWEEAWHVPYGSFIFIFSFVPIFSRNGETAEMRYCQTKSMNYMTLRMVWEAKDQLKVVLRNAGFLDSSLSPSCVSNQGPDENLDLVRSDVLLILALVAYLRFRLSRFWFTPYIRTSAGTKTSARC